MTKKRERRKQFMMGRNKRGLTFAAGLLLVGLMVMGTMAMATAGKPAPKECNDGIDNDGDGDIDLADAGCDNKRDNDETNCGDGVCEGGETSGTCPADCGTPDSCSDTDGSNIWTLGTTSGYYNQTPYSDDDYCSDGSNVVENICVGDYTDTTLQNCGTDGYGGPYCVGDSVYRDYIDHFCGSGACGNSSEAEWVENCTIGCTAGVCDTPPDSCNETDGGFDPYVQGTTSGHSSGDPYTFVDYCVDSDVLNEYYCDWTDPISDNRSCSNFFNATGCASGACY
jgi:hypothetical protein